MNALPDWPSNFWLNPRRSRPRVSRAVAIKKRPRSRLFGRFRHLIV